MPIVWNVARETTGLAGASAVAILLRFSRIPEKFPQDSRRSPEHQQQPSHERYSGFNHSAGKAGNEQWLPMHKPHGSGGEENHPGYIDDGVEQDGGRQLRARISHATT